MRVALFSMRNYSEFLQRPGLLAGVGADREVTASEEECYPPVWESQSQGVTKEDFGGRSHAQNLRLMHVQLTHTQDFKTHVLGMGRDHEAVGAVVGVSPSASP